MNDKKRVPRDIWKTPPRGNEGDAAKEFDPPADEDVVTAETQAADSPALDRRTEEGAEEATPEEPGYSPRHRAPGRAPLIRRKRNRVGDEVEVSWETTWSEEDRSTESSRWTSEEESSVTPPPKPLEELPYLGPRRSEQRRRRPRPGDETPTEIVRRSRDYTGRHLAPKKPARWTRDDESAPPPPPSEGNYVEFQDRARVEAMPPRREALVEGDVDGTDVDEIEEPVETIEAEEAATEAPPTERPAAKAATPVAETPVATPVAETPVEQDAEAGDEAPAPETPKPATPPRTDEPPATAEVAREPAPEAAAPLVARPSEPIEPSAEAEVVALEPTATTTEADLPEAETEFAEPGRPAPPPAPAAIVVPPLPPPWEDPPSDGEDDLEPEVVLLYEEDVEDEEAPPGPRRAALQERKKKQRMRRTIGTVAAVIAAGIAIGAAGVLVKNVVAPEQKVAVPVNQPVAGPALGGTTLLFGTKESNDSGRGAIWMTLVTYDPETEEASVVYIPPHTATEVPGRGLQGVGEAYGSGGVPLLLVSAENLLGVNIDRYVELSDKDALVLFEELNTLTVDVPAEVRVPAGRDEARLIFVEGPQELTPQLLVKLLYIVGIDGDDVELGGRHLAFWQQLLEAHEPEEIESAVEAAGPALGESDAEIRDLARFFAAVAELPAEDVVLTALPVRPISAGDSELYAADSEELAAFVEDTIGVPSDAPQEVRVQLLNGNGVPGLGREVADLLVGEGFRVILGGNAQRLNYRRTLVIAYDSSDEAIATAERARELLGVGEVQISAQQQGIVDLTIVVGKDFLRAH